MMLMMEIVTDRLRLVPPTLAQLRCYVATSQVLERELGLAVSREIVTHRLRRAIERMVSKMERVDPSKHAWCTYPPNAPRAWPPTPRPGRQILRGN